jgi:hypothetical protein
MMKNPLEKDFHSLNRLSRGTVMMQMRMQGRKNKRQAKNKGRGKEKEGKNLRMIIMPLGRFSMLREPFTSRCWRIIMGR